MGPTVHAKTKTAVHAVGKSWFLGCKRDSVDNLGKGRTVTGEYYFNLAECQNSREKAWLDEEKNHLSSGKRT